MLGLLVVIAALGKVEADDLRVVDGGQNGRELSANKALGSALKKSIKLIDL